MWHTGEESGLQGSRWFTDHPTVPRDSIVAQINIDMIARGGPGDVPAGGPGYLEVLGSRRLSTELGDLAERVNTEGKFGFTVQLRLRRERPSGPVLLPERPRQLRAVRHPDRVLQHRAATATTTR